MVGTDWLGASLIGTLLFYFCNNSETSQQERRAKYRQRMLDLKALYWKRQPINFSQ